MESAQEKPRRIITPRLTISFHERLKRAASANGTSLNRYAIAALEAAVLRDEEPQLVPDLGGRPWG
jgi:predicted HicB family RNase H-like nuclease